MAILKYETFFVHYIINFRPDDYGRLTQLFTKLTKIARDKVRTLLYHT